MKTTSRTQRTINELATADAFLDKALQVLNHPFHVYLKRLGATATADIGDRYISIRATRSAEGSDLTASLDRNAWIKIRKHLSRGPAQHYLDFDAVTEPKRNYPTSESMLGFIPFDQLGHKPSKPDLCLHPTNGIRIWFAEPVTIRRSECTVVSLRRRRRYRSYTQFNLHFQNCRIGKKDGVASDTFNVTVGPDRTKEELHAWAEQRLWAEVVASKEACWNLIDDKPSV